jgi:hypothetical protein
MKSIKHIAIAALMLHLGVAGAYANQSSVKMSLSGTSAPVTFSLQPGTNAGEDDFAGDGTLGAFTFRALSAGTATPQSPPSTCSGASNLYFLRVVGSGVFRFQDGSLLMVTLKQGSDCIDLAAQQANCIRIFQITGGTNRFKGASGMFTLTYTSVPVLADSSHAPVFFAANGQFTGTIAGVTAGEDSGDERH